LVGHRVQVIGDDLLVTNAARTRAAGKERLCNAVLIKPNQAGTLSETRAALEAAREAGLGTIISARSGETEDTTIAHLAVGWNAGQLKVGSFARSERMAKWNEVLRIESELGAIARFARRAVLPIHNK
jgi:enolase 1/2/3